MPRTLRAFVAHGIYHVINRGNRKQPIFLSDGDRLLFLDIVRKVKAQRRWIVHGYCLMDNHYHLLLETPEPDLSSGMQRINSEYAQWFNRGYGFVGHVFQGRFRAVLLESDWHLLELTRYIALNPVRAGLCHMPSDWTWSSYADTVDRNANSLASADKLLAFFGTSVERATVAFRRFVEDNAVI